MTRVDVTEILGVGNYSFYHLVNSGKLPGVRYGGKWQVTKKDLDSFRARNPHLPEAPLEPENVRKWLKAVQ
jgi:excisionase family DNA binding protein